MKLKLDENPPLQIAIDLRARSHDVHTVGEEGLTGRPDTDVWQEAQREGRLLVTQDLDFSDVRKFQPGTHHGIVLFQVENVSGWENCFVVVTERKIRIRKPSTRN